MPVAKVFRVVVSGTIGGVVTFNNAFHIATDTAGIGPGLNAADVAANFRNVFIRNPVGPVNDWWLVATSSLNQFNSVSVNSLYPDGSEAGSAGVGANGVDGNPSLPAPCAAVITWRTARTGRSGRGRTYLAGVRFWSGGLTGAGLVAPQAAERTLFTHIGDDFMNHLGPGGDGMGGGWYLVVLSRKLAGSAAPINPAGCFPVTGFSIPNYWATMGSRRGGHGI